MNIKQFNKPSTHIIFLIVIVVVSYIHTFDAGFMFDDYAQQEMLKLIKNGQREMNMFNFITTPDELREYTQMTMLPWWTTPKWRLKYFRPMATLSHFIDYTLWGSNPLPYHVHNVILYAVLVVLLYLFYLSFCNHTAMAFCGALVFALEPCHYLNVYWSASRNDIICAIFLVLSFMCYMHFYREKRLIYKILFIIFYLFALLTKELAYLFPALIFAYDWMKYKRIKEIVRNQWKLYLSLIIINSIYLVFYLANGYGSSYYAGRFLSDYPLDFLKAASICLCSLFYGSVVAGLSPYILSKYLPIIVLCILLLFYIVYLIWKERKRYPEINFFILWIFIQLPFIAAPPVNDRLLLIHSIGYAYLAALAIFKLGKKRLALFFIATGLLFPPIINTIQAYGYDEAVHSNYKRLYDALDEIAVHKTSQDRLFFINFPKVSLSGENYMYLGLYLTLSYHYPQWKAPVYPLSPFDENVSVQILDNYHIKISHPTRFYFDTTSEKIFSLDSTFLQGEVFSLPDVKITIDEMEGAKVKSLDVEFTEEIDSPRYYFLYFDRDRWQRWRPLEEKNPFGKGQG